MTISLERSKELVESKLRDFINAKKLAALAIHPAYSQLLSEVERTIFAGGKRLRPHLAFIGYGRYDATITNIAAAHELLHVAMLVHDDIIDRDEVRHSEPTIHQRYHTNFYSNSDLAEEDLSHFSMSSALLAGDLLISFAYELLAGADLAPDLYAKVTSYFATGVFEVVGGELLDVEASFIDYSYDPLIIYRYKTASYSCISPLLTGASCSSASYDEATLTKIQLFASNLGIAFQIQDDVLGVFGDEQQTGKSSLNDLREGKRTLLIDQFYKLADNDLVNHFEQSFGNKQASPQELSEVKQNLLDSGALKATSRIGDDYTQKATSTLKALPFPELQNDLAELIGLLNRRKA